MIQYFFDIPARLLFFCVILLPFLASLLMGPSLIAVLRRMKAGQPIRQKSATALAPDHEGKKGTPTMGGIMIISLMLLTMLIFGDLSSPALQCCLFILISTAGLGFLDDFAKIRQKGTDGVSGWVKIIIQTAAATAVSFYFYHKSPDAGQILIPFWDMVDIGIWFIPLSILVIVASSNAVNLTDGIDGLASGTIAIVAGLFTVIITQPELNLFLACMCFACLGFLWFNAHPAKIFMGDTGSLALGGALGTVAICSGNHLSFIIVGGIFVLEAASVILQRLYFKYTRIKTGEGVRLFRMAPIHHHFEKCGWSETQVCIRFWTISLLLGLISGLGWYLAVINY